MCLVGLLDGMVAVEGGLGSRSGEVFNEVPDRIADPLLIVPAGYACGLVWGPELAWTAGLLALLTAYIRALGGTLGLPQSFAGPMAKPHRMATMTIALITASLLCPWGLDGPVLMVALILIFPNIVSYGDPAEKARLEKEIAAAQKELAGCEKTLANEGFVAKAAPAVVQKKRDRAAELKEILVALTSQVADFS